MHTASASSENVTPNPCSEYSEERRRIDREVWSFVEPIVKGKTVIDVGVGDSTKKLVKLGAITIGVDRDLQKLKEASGFPILCDFLHPPFRGKADVVVFYFTLHEIGPLLHTKAISIARELAPRIVIVEPSPEGNEVYNEYAELWRVAMYSIGRFEDYKPIEYWRSLLEGSDFRISSKTIRWRVNVPLDELKEIINATIEEWRRLRVKQEYIEGLKDLLKRAKEIGFGWSDVNVLVGTQTQL